jgi:hypothetical protein
VLLLADLAFFSRHTDDYPSSYRVSLPCSSTLRSC